MKGGGWTLLPVYSFNDVSVWTNTLGKHISASLLHSSYLIHVCRCVSACAFVFSTLLPLASLLLFVSYSSFLPSLHFYIKELQISLQNLFSRCLVNSSLVLTWETEPMINCSRNYCCVFYSLCREKETDLVRDISHLQLINFQLIN